MKQKDSTTKTFDPRFQIIAEMMSVYVQEVRPERVKAFLKYLKDLGTTELRAACAGCIENQQQRGMPSVSDIRRRAASYERRQIEQNEPEEPLPYRECRKVVHRTAFGKLLCCREEGHIGDCEVWFDRSGPKPDDQETIQKLLNLKKPERSASDFEPAIGDDIPF